MNEPNFDCTPVDGLLKISGELTIAEATDFHRSLVEHLRPELIVDLSGVTACDTTGLQLIFALQQSGAELSAISPAIKETAAALGLEIKAPCADKA